MIENDLAQRVREHLGQEHRYGHCMRVADMARDLALVHGENPEAAHTAGMLHDLARLYPAQRLLEESEQRGVPIDAYAREHPVVLHAPLSAAIARDDFGVRDAAILSAIAKHTLAAPEMSALDCILYLSDGLEPGRNFPERAGLAEFAKLDLFAATLATIRSSLRYLKASRTSAAPQTLAALAALEERYPSPMEA